MLASRSLMSSSLAVYARSSDYVAVGARRLVHAGDPARSAAAARAAGAAIERLDDTFRESLAERMPRRLNMERPATLVDGAERVRRVGRAVTALGPATTGHKSLEECGGNLDREVDALRSWYVQLGDALVHGAAIPPPHVRDVDGRTRVLECVRIAIAEREKAKIEGAVALLWASRYLDGLWRLESHLGQHAGEPWSAT
jgi:hypothetical protein